VVAKRPSEAIGFENNPCSPASSSTGLSRDCPVGRLITLQAAVCIYASTLAIPARDAPTIQIDCNYPGAGAKVVAETMPPRSSNKSTASRT